MAIIMAIMEALVVIIVLSVVGATSGVKTPPRPVVSTIFTAKGELEHHLPEETRFGNCEGAL